MQVNETILKQISQDLLCGFKVYLHRETGEILTTMEADLMFDEEDPWEEDRQKVEQAPGKYLAFEPMASHESYRMMEDFINQLDDDELARRLANAIEKKRPFAHFKNEIDHSGPFQEKWFEFRDQHYINWTRSEWEMQLKAFS